jgi:hypothetical protein
MSLNKKEEGLPYTFLGLGACFRSKTPAVSHLLLCAFVFINFMVTLTIFFF